jgi:nucleolar pre-ribosomal-associated protein 1
MHGIGPTLYTEGMGSPGLPWQQELIPPQPASSNKHLQSVVQHPKFLAICNPSVHSTARDQVIQLLRELFFVHPQNSSQPSHIEPLRAIYGGTLSRSDRTILSIFHLFEAHKKLSCTSLLSTWSSPGGAGSADALQALLSLDAGKVFHTCLNFPRKLKFDLDHEYRDKSGFLEEMYDPLFLNLLFARVISGNPPSSGLSWVQFFRVNIVCVVIRTLSSKDDQFRELALCNLSGLWKLSEVQRSLTR